MAFIDEGLWQLKKQLAYLLPELPGLRRLSVPVASPEAHDPLAWLAAQPHFPQFYWQQRGHEDEAAALGTLRRFSSLADAQTFLRHSGDPQLRIWGLNAFDPQHGDLFLPRLEWRREGAQTWLCLTLWSDTSLREDARHAATFLDQLHPATPFSPLPLQLTSEQHSPDHAGWCQRVRLATQAIERQDMDKVVLARASDLRFSQPVNAAALMAASRRVNFSCYHFYMAFSPQDAFLGSTPERLWRRIGPALRTEALAGTVENHTDDHRARALGQWLLEDDKNQRENQLVVDDICQRLEPLGNGYDILPAQVLRLRKVQHLRRCIWMTLNTPDDAQCLRQLQPTAAVAGLPREAAREFIRQHEPFSRDWYAGSAGYLSLKQTEFCVALRSARVTGDTVRLYAGAGIVAGSDPQREWQEIENKAAGLRSVLLMD
ncbi:isochorismate synthase MenF [Enterobacter sp. ENT03]|uniref:isochorismate synthase MenF n=1 Tax=Enterobacter sp. ENT03 TaxID=2854780 RepID=UPI00352712FA